MNASKRAKEVGSPSKFPPWCCNALHGCRPRRRPWHIPVSSDRPSHASGRIPPSDCKPTTRPYKMPYPSRSWPPPPAEPCSDKCRRHRQTDLPAHGQHNALDRGGRSPSCLAARLLARQRAVIGITMRITFLAAFWKTSSPSVTASGRGDGPGSTRLRLHLVPVIQQGAIVTFQLVGELLCRYALHEAARINTILTQE